MTSKQKKTLVRIILAAALLVGLAFAPVEGWLRLALYMVPYLLVGYDILRKAFKGILNGRIFDENFLMAVATVGAIAIAVYDNTGDYTEAVAVMLFYQIGEWFQAYAVGKSRRNISDLMDIRPDYANIEKDGALERVDPDTVEKGTVIVVQPGEKVPLDGVVVSGSSSLNTSALTGESLPRSVAEGDEIISGCINLTGLLKVRTTKLFGESTVSQILELVENASSRKSKSEAFITRLHADRVLLGARPGHSSAPGAHVPDGSARGLGRLDLPCARLSRDQLPVRARHQHSAVVLRGHRRREQGGHPRQGIELP